MLNVFEFYNNPLISKKMRLKNHTAQYMRACMGVPDTFTNKLGLYLNGFKSKLFNYKFYMYPIFIYHNIAATNYEFFVKFDNND